MRSLQQLSLISAPTCLSTALLAAEPEIRQRPDPPRQVDSRALAGRLVSLLTSDSFLYRKRLPTLAAGDEQGDSICHAAGIPLETYGQLDMNLGEKLQHGPLPSLLA